jgi:outer membrane receptor protein involved in Fe transport
LNWVQRIGDQWKITPGVRYYSQSAADFYAPIIISLPRQYQSSDQRLAAFGSFTPSIKASWQVSPGTVFEASYARLIQQGNWKLGGGGTSTFERFSADLLTVGVVHQF